LAFRIVVVGVGEEEDGIPVLHGREAGDHGDAFGLIFVRGGVVVFGDGEGLPAMRDEARPQRAEEVGTSLMAVFLISQSFMSHWRRGKCGWSQ